MTMWAPAGSMASRTVVTAFIPLLKSTASSPWSSAASLASHAATVGLP